MISMGLTKSIFLKQIPNTAYNDNIITPLVIPIMPIIWFKTIFSFKRDLASKTVTRGKAAAIGATIDV